jgi:hypothetical protein
MTIDAYVAPENQREVNWCPLREARPETVGTANECSHRERGLGFVVLNIYLLP